MGRCSVRGLGCYAGVGMMAGFLLLVGGYLALVFTTAAMVLWLFKNDDCRFMAIGAVVFWLAVATILQLQ